MKIYSLSIGVAYTDENHYGTDLTQLPCCMNDARYVHRFSELFNYDESNLLLNEQATVASVKQEITRYSKLAEKDDLVIIYYSGHGGRIIDMNFDEPIEEGLDQTFCLYDRQIIDDEFRYLWKKFKEGVNILFIADSCHSGTVFKETGTDVKFENTYDYSSVVKSVSSNTANSIYLRNKHLYNPILKTPLVKEDEIKCAIFSIAACQDNEEAIAGFHISFFTRVLITTLSKKTNEISNYKELANLLSTESVSKKGITPNIESYGKSSSFFSNTKPFLKDKQEYPNRTSNLYSNLILDNNLNLEKKIEDNGLIVELFNKTEREFVEKEYNGSLKVLQNKDVLFLLSNENLTKSAMRPWDRAHLLYDQLKEDNITAFIEPDLIPVNEIEIEKEREERTTNNYLKNWPNPPVGSDNEFTWHLEDKFSQLNSALNHLKDRVPVNELKIKIAQIDTGYSPNHPGIPENIEEGVSFVKGEEGQPAYDIPTSKWIQQEDHGTATASILAGKNVPENLAYGNGNTKIGAIPFANVYPIRISDTVALTAILGNTMPFVYAIKQAIAQKCEVVTMSMGGLPTRAWAKVINQAYEAGITVVTAGGNSWVKGFAKIAPKKILYPARFDRVIAAVGVCYNQYPYVAKANPGFSLIESNESETMQGNYYPKSAMRTAIAAYTPNIPWSVFTDKEKENPIIERSGAGTSSATPQIAAAAAMWITKNKKELIERGYHGTWKQVEAVKYALFTSAKKKNIVEWKKYYGNGILQAREALNVEVPDLDQLKKARKARITFGFLKYIQLILFRKSGNSTLNEVDELRGEMIFQEMLQVMEQDPELINKYKDVDLIDMTEGEELTIEQLKEITIDVAQSPYSSGFFKQNVRVK